MQADEADLTRVLKSEHGGKWVALARDHSKVEAVGETMEEVSAKAGEKDVVLMLVPDFDKAFVPSLKV